ncbi:IQ-domain [Ranunculus cassubicifolius]
MGSGDWFKTIISLKKAKKDKIKQDKVSSATEKSNGHKGVSLQELSDGTSNPGLNGKPVEDIAAIRIQTAFRAYKARKYLRRLKGVVRFKVLSERESVTKQASTALNYIHSWSKIQTQIRVRRQCMVTEGRIKQKKLENQLKLEAKLHDLEVDWCGGTETMEEVLARIQQREDAAVKRERAMAYAFSHQWRANANGNQGKAGYELGNANWGWSWTERWIAARPWENRLPFQAQSISPAKDQTKQASKIGKQKSPPAIKLPLSMKPNGKTVVKVKAGHETNGKTVFPAKIEDTFIKQAQLVS